MALSGFEIAAAARLLSPLVKDLYQGAKGVTETNFKKWKATDFPQKLAKKIAVADKVKTIWSPEKNISLLSFFYPCSIIIKDQQEKQVNSLQDLGTENVVIQGIVGQGKSVLLRYLGLQELAGTGSGRIPLFIELRTLSSSKGLKEHIQESLEKLDLLYDEQLFSYLADTGRLVLLLDGFDELDENLVKGAVDYLEYLSEKHENLQIVVTSRPGNEIQKSRHFQVTKLARLSKDDYPGFLSKLKIPPTRIAEITLAIEASPSQVSDLINTPLMLTLLVMVYESEKEIPSELPEFFERLFQTVFTRHDRLKAGFMRKHYSGLSERKLQRFFEAFCFMVLQHRYGRSLNSEQFETAFEHAMEYSEDKCELDNFRHDITKVACLMLEEGLDLTTFIHKSIMEYFAAAFIKHAADGAAQLFYEEVGEAFRPWLEVLSFLQKIDPYRHARYYTIPTHERLLNEIHSKNNGASDEALLRFCRTHFLDMGVTYAPIPLPHAAKLDMYEMSEIGPIARIDKHIGHLDEEVSDAVVAALEGVLPEPISLRDLQSEPELYVLVSEEHNAYQVTLVQTLNICDQDKFLKPLRSLDSSVHRALQNAKDIIQREDRKKLIFGKK